MPEASLTITIEGISPEQLQQLAELPAQVETLLGSAKADLERVLDGQASGNPLSDLLETLAGLAEQAGNLPDLPDLARPFSDLLGELPTGGLADLTQVRVSIDGALGLFGPLKETLLTGDLEQVLQDGLDKSLDLVSGLRGQSDALAGPLRELAEFFRLFGALLGWSDRPPRPEEVVDLLSRALLGFGPDLLARPVAALEVALAPLDELLPVGADLTAWQGLPTAQLTLWQGLDARLAASTSLDWPALAAELRVAHGQMLESIAARDRLLARLAASLDTLRLPGLPEVALALDAVPRIQPVRLQPIVDGLRGQLRGLSASLDGLSLDEQQARRVARAVVAHLLSGIERSGLAELRGLLVTAERRLVAAIESLPFRDLARQAEQALRQVAEAADLLDPDSLRRPLREFFETLTTPIDEVAGEAVRASIGELWEGVESALDEVTTQVEAIQATIEDAVGGIQSFVGSVQPTLTTITTQVTTIRTTLQAFDLEQPASVTIEDLRALRDVVAAIDVSLLPAPAVSTLKQGAETLRSIELAATVSGPLDEVLEAVDPTPLLEQAAETLGPLVAQLRALDPGSLSVDLDRPVDELLAALNQVSPARLREAIDEALEPLREEVRSLDFVELLAPLTRAYAELVARVDGLLDPDAIFEPLEALYQPVLDVLDKLEPSRLIEKLEPSGPSVGERVAATAGPPVAVAAGFQTLREALPAGPETEDELFGFRPGDLLVPLIDLHRRLMAAFDDLADETLEPAGALLRDSVAGSLGKLDPTAVLARIDQTLDGALALLEPPVVSERLAEAALAYHAAASRIAAASRLELSAGDRAVALEVAASLPSLDPLLLVPSTSQADQLRAALRRAADGTALADLRRSFAKAGPGLTGLLPSFLTSGDLGAAELRQALRDLDPTPFRVEINALFDEVGQKLRGLEDALAIVLEELTLAGEELLESISPGSLVALAVRLHAVLKEQVAALGPATFKDEVALLFDVVRRQLAALDPANIAAELNALREALLAKVDGLVDALLPDPAAFDALLVRLAGLKPSRLLATLSATLRPLAELVAMLDPEALVQPIIDAIARIRAQLPQVLADIEAALDEVLGALQEGGISSVSVTVEARAG